MSAFEYSITFPAPPIASENYAIFDVDGSYYLYCSDSVLVTGSSSDDLYGSLQIRSSNLSHTYGYVLTNGVWSDLGRGASPWYPGDQLYATSYTTIGNYIGKDLSEIAPNASWLVPSDFTSASVPGIYNHSFAALETHSPLFEVVSLLPAVLVGLVFFIGIRKAWRWVEHVLKGA